MTESRSRWLNIAVMTSFVMLTASLFTHLLGWWTTVWFAVAFVGLILWATFASDDETEDDESEGP